jgi:hypothetical protein
MKIIIKQITFLLTRMKVRLFNMAEEGLNPLKIQDRLRRDGWRERTRYVGADNNEIENIVLTHKNGGELDIYMIEMHTFQELMDLYRSKQKLNPWDIRDALDFFNTLYNLNPDLTYLRKKVESRQIPIDSTQLELNFKEEN